MSPLMFRLPKGWPSIELPGYRPHPDMATYSLFDAASPSSAIEPLDPDLNWLQAAAPVPDSLSGSLGQGEGVEEDPESADSFLNGSFAAVAAVPGLHLPLWFVNFMTSPELQSRIRSCTACYLLWPNYVVKTGGSEAGFLVHFLSDQQWCLHWHLYVNEAGDHCVIASWDAYGFPSEELDGDEDADTAEGASSVGPDDVIDLEQQKDLWVGAASFDEFLYRFRMENEIWYALAWDKRPLNSQEQEYIDVYMQAVE